jgi:putative tricarboxylic transport membrane protein
VFEGFVEGLGHVVRWEGVALALLAVVIGLAADILPGVSAVTMMALLLPVIFGMDKYDALLFLAALMAAGGFAGSITSILLNVPGDGINAATTLDGYPMARAGKAGVAIGASATASGLGALIGIAVLALALPVVREIVLAFSPPEFFALAIAGIALVATVSAKSPLKGITAGMLGMALGFIGISIALGGTRYTFGFTPLQDGIALIPAVIGLFALPEMFELLRRNEAVSREGIVVRGGVWEGVKEVLRRPGVLIRSSLIGSTIGMLPGVGGSVAWWVAYFAAERTS